MKYVKEFVYIYQGTPGSFLPPEGRVHKTIEKKNNKNKTQKPVFSHLFNLSPHFKDTGYEEMTNH